MKKTAKRMAGLLLTAVMVLALDGCASGEVKPMDAWDIAPATEATQPTETRPAEPTQPGAEPAATEPETEPATEPMTEPTKAVQAGSSGGTDSKPVPQPTVPPASTRPPHTHSYTAVNTVAPTCTMDGYTTYRCSCGDGYNGDTVKATGHSWGEWTTTKEATTEAEGEQARTCAACGSVDTQAIPKLEKVSWTPDLAAASAAGNAYITSLGWTVGSPSLGGYFPSYSIDYQTALQNGSQEWLNQKARDEVAATYSALLKWDGEEAMQYVSAYCSVYVSGEKLYITVYYG